MNRQTFFTELRKRSSGVFSTSLSSAQVTGVESILDASVNLPIEFNAYLLATAYHETGGKMAPNRENLNYSPDGLLNTFGRHRITAEQALKYGRTKSRPADQVAIANIIYGGEWGRKYLGNTERNDGWDFRGGGQAHTTGRTNFDRVKKATGVDVLSNPELIVDPSVSSVALVQGSVEGWYTGKSLGDYLPGDYYNARRVINGTDSAEKIAGYARAFENALKAAGGVSTDPPPVLRRGSKGPDVIDMQTLLSAKGYELVADGDFGKITYDALVDFQLHNNLDADGVCGKNTWAALKGE